MNSPSEITPHEVSSAEDERFVASGSTSTCYLLRRQGRLMLKKQLLPTYAVDERHREALRKEFELGCRLNHPNIPHYLEYQGDWLLMDYVDGVTLTDFLRQHPNYFRKKRHARQFAEELLSAVDYLHSRQILHLDLKPDNIMLTRIGCHVKLIDLGYCYQDSYPFTSGSTPHYAAPDKKKTPATDIYSIGVIFSEIGIGYHAVTARCQRENAADRYQSVGELAAAMRKPHRLWLTIAAILLLLAGGLVWWGWRENAADANGQATPSADSATVNDSNKSAADNVAICVNDGFTCLTDINSSDFNTVRSKFRTIRLDLSSAHTNTNGNYASITLHNLETGVTDWFRNRIQTLAKPIGQQIRDDSYSDRSIIDVGSLVPGSDNLYEYTFSADMEIYVIDANVDKSMVWLKLATSQNHR